ncbi:hypothetical protein MSG28_005355 [Choristoneura fumiferana]|uniref:Uncharacterized protein n=1 Tax=Choristoneura fumiferana TaxID=7141 RepID=A0ACC0JQX3_CHOFU|nr:hypothetical protein MSG28_005355 [Choristoneura fumiferana]
MMSGYYDQHHRWEPLAEFHINLDSDDDELFNEDNYIYCLCSRVCISESDVEVLQDSQSQEWEDESHVHFSLDTSYKVKCEKDEGASCYCSASHTDNYCSTDEHDPAQIHGNLSHALQPSDSGADLTYPDCHSDFTNHYKLEKMDQDFPQTEIDENYQSETSWDKFWAVNGERLIWASWIKKYSDYINPNYLDENNELSIDERNIPKQHSADAIFEKENDRFKKNVNEEESMRDRKFSYDSKVNPYKKKKSNQQVMEKNDKNNDGNKDEAWLPIRRMRSCSEHDRMLSPRTIAGTDSMTNVTKITLSSYDVTSSHVTSESSPTDDYSVSSSTSEDQSNDQTRIANIDDNQDQPLSEELDTEQYWQYIGSVGVLLQSLLKEEQKKSESNKNEVVDTAEGNNKSQSEPVNLESDIVDGPLELPNAQQNSSFNAYNSNDDGNDPPEEKAVSLKRSHEIDDEEEDSSEIIKDTFETMGFCVNSSRMPKGQLVYKKRVARLRPPRNKRFGIPRKTYFDDDGNPHEIDQAQESHDEREMQTDDDCPAVKSDNEKEPKDFDVPNGVLEQEADVAAIAASVALPPDPDDQEDEQIKNTQDAVVDTSVANSESTKRRRRQKRHAKADDVTDMPIELQGEPKMMNVTPENVAWHIADKCRYDVVLDAFCGAGGNTIQFAKTCKKVIAIDIDPAKVALARQNAAVYGVSDRIEFVVGDFFELAPTLSADMNVEYDLETMLEPRPASELMEAARTINNNIALYLPRNSRTDQLPKFHFATIAFSYVLGCLACYYGLNSSILDSLVNKLKCHLVIAGADEENEEENDTGCATCGSSNCPRHDPVVSTEPWVGLQIHKQLDQAIEDFYNAILEQFITSWYSKITLQPFFVDELRHQLRYASACLLRRAVKINYSRFITERLIPCALRHYTLCADLPDAAPLLASKLAVHPAAANRNAELKYLRSVTNAIMPYLLKNGELQNSSWWGSKTSFMPSCSTLRPQDGSIYCSSIRTSEGCEILARYGALHGAGADEFKKMLENGADIKRLQTSPALYQAARESHAALEKIMLPRFLHSEEQTRITAAALKSALRSSTLDGQILDVFTNAEETDDSVENINILKYLDSIAAEDRIDGTRGERPWGVERSEHDFHLLRAKLIEFHGERLDNSPNETLRYKYEDFLQRVLQKSLLQTSELLHLFLTVDGDFSHVVQASTLNANSSDLGNIYQSVTHKLRKEKGQHLENNRDPVNCKQYDFTLDLNYNLNAHLNDSMKFVVDSLVNKLKCHLVIAGADEENEEENDTGCATCGSSNCPRHDPVVSTEPWVGLQIHKQLDQAIEDINYSRFITERLIPCALRHYTLCADLPDAAPLLASKLAVHPAAANRNAELKYLRSVTNAIMPYLLKNGELQNSPQQTRITAAALKSALRSSTLDGQILDVFTNAEETDDSVENINILKYLDSIAAEDVQEQDLSTDNSPNETLRYKYEDFLQRVLQKSLLQTSELLHLFLTVDGDFSHVVQASTLNANSSDLGNIYQSESPHQRAQARAQLLGAAGGAALAAGAGLPAALDACFQLIQRPQLNKQCK